MRMIFGARAGNGEDAVEKNTVAEMVRYTRGVRCHPERRFGSDDSPACAQD